MRYFLFYLFLLPAFAQSKDEADVLATVEKTFRGMAAHDGDMIRSTMLPDARLYATRDADAAVTSRSLDEFVTQIATSKGALIERLTGRPQVNVHRGIAQIWSEYEFVRDGKLSHCGIDSVLLFKTTGGWKIASLSYTVEPTGCKNQ